MSILEISKNKVFNTHGILNFTQLQFYKNNGYLIIENFVSHSICQLLIERVNYLINHFNAEEIKTIFSTKNQRHAQNLYFLESGHKIRFFFEEGALDEHGALKYEIAHSINKIGHALHSLDPVFNCFSHSHKIATLVNDLGVTNPLLVQSMHICKQPYIGGEVKCHQDSTYLYVEDEPVIGLWFALEDATLENSCLWAIPGGHQIPLKSRMHREGDNTTIKIYDNSPWQLDKMVPLEVKRGSLIVLHGLLPHMSKENVSPRSRHAYSLHVISSDHQYAHDNWLCESKHMPFTGFF